MNALARERAAIAIIQENDMQPKSIHGAAPGFRVLDQNAASAMVRRQMRPTSAASLTNLAGEQDTNHRRADRSIDFDFYRRRATAPPRPGAARRRDVDLGRRGHADDGRHLPGAVFCRRAHARIERHSAGGARDGDPGRPLTPGSETHPSTHWSIPWAVSSHCFTESPPTRCASSRFSMRSLLSATCRCRKRSTAALWRRCRNR